MEREVLILVLAHLIYFSSVMRAAHGQRLGGIIPSLLLVLLSMQYDEFWGKVTILYTLVIELALLFWAVYNSKALKEWKEKQKK